MGGSIGPVYTSNAKANSPTPYYGSTSHIRTPSGACGPSSATTTTACSTSPEWGGMIDG